MNKPNTTTSKFSGKRQRSVRGRGKTQFRGISAAATTLGVSRFHLWEVLKGRRTSPGLINGWKSLQSTPTK